ncbi:magnesium transporter [Sulfurimonas aquatica]|uniref:Magnesium transporter MgtE n=1 Tax=Sulfurimonas aquatica TaxID=2672570 RepID=A0A975B298_9BACT|nr:magnesium transporter [Sulfurimonas aquatica]QSZ42926.1 magnesium transporter [Sulfurimonas aquatica]
MEIDQEELTSILHILETEINQYKESETSVHPYDIAEQLLKVRGLSNQAYEQIIKKIPSSLFADILSELPNHVQEETADILSVKKLANIALHMDTDDAATLIQNISEDHEDVSQNILERFTEEDKEIIEQLISYEEYEAGSYMQTELFHAKIDENIGKALERLRGLKTSGDVDNIWHVHLVNERNKYLGSIGLEELIIFDRDLNFEDVPYEKHKNYSVNHKQNIKEVVEMVTNYNLNAIAVLDDKNRLVGRITSDDIIDIIQESATEQIFNLAGVNDEAEQEENMFQIGKTRAIWLGLNLLTAIAASLVIGMFDATIQSLVALAILMPIVASMGGNAGTQTLTVTVRQMALGDIEGDDAKKTIYKEVIISLVNGTLFAVLIGVIAYLWFNMPMLGVVIGLSMIINLLGAGFFGSVIPLVLQKAGVDPAIGSTVLLTTVTDVVGFFSFLGLASIILL